MGIYNGRKTFSLFISSVFFTKVLGTANNSSYYRYQMWNKSVLAHGSDVWTSTFPNDFWVYLHAYTRKTNSICLMSQKCRCRGHHTGKGLKTRRIAIHILASNSRLLRKSGTLILGVGNPLLFQSGSMIILKSPKHIYQLLQVGKYLSLKYRLCYTPLNAYNTYILLITFNQAINRLIKSCVHQRISINFYKVKQKKFLYIYRRKEGLYSFIWLSICLPAGLDLANPHGGHRDHILTGCVHPDKIPVFSFICWLEPRV